MDRYDRVMKEFFLLVLLSQNGAGDINASFVNTDTLDQCKQKYLVVEGIFSSAAIPILDSRCIQTDLRFSVFKHGESSRTSRQFYLIRFDDERVGIQPMSGWRSCMEKQKQVPSTGRHYCSSSIQKIIE